MDLPVEIWEYILQYCDGRTLIKLQRTSVKLKNFILSLDQRYNIWQQRCLSEIPTCELTDICEILNPDALVWKMVFGVWCRWKNIKNWAFSVMRLPGSYLSITDLKTSGTMIVVGDKVGFTILNSVTGVRKLYRISAVKNLELFRSSHVARPAGTRFKHDVLDCTLLPHIHYFFDLHTSRHIRKDKRENCIIKYSRGNKLIVPRRLSSEKPIHEADLFKTTQLLISRHSIDQVISESVALETPYRFELARCWFMWQARLLMCATEDTLDVYFDGQIKRIRYQGFPRISAIYFFCGVLFLGTVYGTLYIYNVFFDDIQTLDLENYVTKIDVCKKPIVAVQVMENGPEVDEGIIVSTENRIYRISPQHTSTGCK